MPGFTQNPEVLSTRGTATFTTNSSQNSAESNALLHTISFPPPSSDSVSPASIVSSFFSSSPKKVESTLVQGRGAVLLRGLNLATPADFSLVLDVIGPLIGKPHVEVGRPPLRTELAKNVVTANEGPSDAPIFMHNEYGWSKITPSYVFFFGLQPAASGGQTPLVSGVDLYRRLEAEVPQLADALRAKGIRYVYRYLNDRVLTSNVGASIRDAYGQHFASDDTPAIRKEKTEEAIREHSSEFIWNEDGSVSVTHTIYPVQRHLPSNQLTLFSNLVSAYQRSAHYQALQPPFLGSDGGYHPLPAFGDGSEMPVEWLEELGRIADEETILVEWQKGDVLMLDNNIVLHGRKTWTGERRVLASLWDSREVRSERVN